VSFPPRVRDERPPDDAALVIRGGLHSLDLDKVRAVCLDSMADSGFYGLSVFVALDGDVMALCERIGRLRSPGTIWVARCGELRARGFDLLATDASPHYDVVLPDIAGTTITRVITCFEMRPNPLRER
jgi:hypothetical protein